MKKISILLIFFFTLHANELQWVDNQIEDIKPPRSGMNIQIISQLVDPFIFIKKEEIKPKEEIVKSTTNSSPKKRYKSSRRLRHHKREIFHLYMTMNKSAMINKKWYKVGDTIHGYKIQNIELSTVTLTKNKNKLLLSTNSKNLNLHFK